MVNGKRGKHSVQCSACLFYFLTDSSSGNPHRRCTSYLGIRQLRPILTARTFPERARSRNIAGLMEMSRATCLQLKATGSTVCFIPHHLLEKKKARKQGQSQSTGQASFTLARILPTLCTLRGQCVLPLGRTFKPCETLRSQSKNIEDHEYCQAFLG